MTECLHSVHINIVICEVAFRLNLLKMQKYEISFEFTAHQTQEREGIIYRIDVSSLFLKTAKVL